MARRAAQWHSEHVSVQSVLHADRASRSMYVSAELPTYPSLDLDLTFCPRRQLRINVRFGEGWVGSSPEKYIDPNDQFAYHHFLGASFVAGFDLHFYRNAVKRLVHTFSCAPSSVWCTWKVWRAVKK